MINGLPFPHIETPWGNHARNSLYWKIRVIRKLIHIMKDVSYCFRRKGLKWNRYFITRHRLNAILTSFVTQNLYWLGIFVIWYWFLSYIYIYAMKYRIFAPLIWIDARALHHTPFYHTPLSHHLLEHLCIFHADYLEVFPLEHQCNQRIWRILLKEKMKWRQVNNNSLNLFHGINSNWNVDNIHKLKVLS